MPTTLLAFLRHFLRRHRKAFLCILFLSMAWPIEQVIFPYAIKLFIDGISNYSGDRTHVMDALTWPLTLGIVVWISSVIAWRLNDICDCFFSPRFQADIRLSVTEYVFGHSHRYFSEHLSGSIANKINDIVRASQYLVTQSTLFFFPNLIAVLLTAAFMVPISGVFSLIILLWATVHLTICAYTSRICDRASTKHSELKSELQGRIVDSVANFITVRLFARITNELAYLQGFQQREIKAHRHLILTTCLVRALLEIPCFIMMACILYFLINGWKAGNISNGDAVFILNTSLNLMYLLWRVGMEFPAYYREIGICRQALSLITEPHELTDAPNAIPLHVTHGEIVFDHVHFHYQAGQNLFQDKNLHIGAGEKVGLVGFSGSGKSTFVSLLLRLYDVEAGSIRIDGQNIAHVTQDSLRAQISLIPQEVSLFHRSLKENIAYGDLNAGMDAIIAASKQAHCHTFITSTPEGYDAIVGERGVKLSGGQRQRIAIARALLKNAPILILDEATSSLDSITEQIIQEQLWPMMKGKTVITVAHRLSTLTRMDRILVFKDGAIIEDGSHDALLALNEHYAMLWRMQVDGFVPENAS